MLHIILSAMLLKELKNAGTFFHFFVSFYVNASFSVLSMNILNDVFAYSKNSLLLIEEQFLIWLIEFMDGIIICGER